MIIDNFCCVMLEQACSLLCCSLRALLLSFLPLVFISCHRYWLTMLHHSLLQSHRLRIKAYDAYGVDVNSFHLFYSLVTCSIEIDFFFSLV